MKKTILITISVFVINTNVFSQENPSKNVSQHEVVILAGMIQSLLLRGGNFEIDFYTRKMIFEYSHGFSLEMSEEFGTIPKQPKEQHVAYHIPFSTGFGVGYRLNRYFDFRFEPKLHRFEAYYEGSDRNQAENNIVQYTTATLGVGAYFRWKPFEKRSGFTRVITVATSIRYWQNILSTLDDNNYSYSNKVTQRQETLKASSIGIAGSPVIFNISVGYSFEVGRQKNPQ